MHALARYGSRKIRDYLHDAMLMTSMELAVPICKRRVTTTQLVSHFDTFSLHASAADVLSPKQPVRGGLGSCRFTR